MDNFDLEIDRMIKEMEDSVTKDAQSIAEKAGQFIDTKIIKHKFERGFENQGHKLSPRTIAIKKEKGQPLKVGTATGRLKKAATSFLSWSIHDAQMGRDKLVMQKKGNLTPYANKIRTKAGGDLKVLQLTTDDFANLRTFFSSAFNEKGYEATGQFRLTKEAGD